MGAKETRWATSARRGTQQPGPVLLAIAGDSAAGKTTFARCIEEVFGSERVTTICADDYHKYDRVQRAELGITPLHPRCNYIDILEQHLGLLAQGEAILKPVYDHSTGSFTAPTYIEPREVVVVEGLLPLHSRAMRECFDVMVYLDPEDDLRRGWKIKRDCSKRGYQPAQVLEEMVRREPDVAAFITPQRDHADIVVRFHPEPDASNGHLNARLVLRPTLSHPSLEALAALAALAGGSEHPPIRLRLERDRGKPVDVLEIDGECPAGAARDFEEVLWRRMEPDGVLRREAIGMFDDGTERHRSETLALAQLLIVYQLWEGRQED